jgi:hypothetical protein
VDRFWEYINRSQTHNVKIEAEAAQFPEKEYINGIAVAKLTKVIKRIHRGKQIVFVYLIYCNAIAIFQNTFIHYCTLALYILFVFHAPGTLDKHNVFFLFACSQIHNHRVS